MAGIQNLEIVGDMQRTILLKQNTFCLICEGAGHIASNCGTKRRIDKITKGTGMRQYWGRFKSDKKIEFMGDKADIARDLRNQEFARLTAENNKYIAQELERQREQGAKASNTANAGQDANRQGRIPQQQPAQFVVRPQRPVEPLPGQNLGRMEDG